MDEKTQAEVNAFVALPRAERRVKYSLLSSDAKKEARKIIEARRGIEKRAEDGTIVHTKDVYTRLILQSQTKLNEIPKRTKTLKANVVELKKQLLEHWGDEALSEAEEAIESLPDNK